MELLLDLGAENGFEIGPKRGEGLYPSDISCVKYGNICVYMKLLPRLRQGFLPFCV